ncbi:MAG: hypothetical protein LCI00_32370 [Chloroflexi bacterium]|nr:hypothetical protein [Chloroflexota bacterium]MCC6894636.1 ATP-binding protein [Anaerolineae bacterium]
MSENPLRYSSDGDIVRLNPMEHVRKRPGMYIGGTDAKALHYLIYEVVDNSIDLAFAGQCNHIWVTLRDNNEVCIRDNGIGIPTDMISDTKKSKLEMIMTVIGMGGRYVPKSEEYHVSVNGGIHGVGLSAVNALSEQLSVETTHDGFLWKQEYYEGKPHIPVTKVRPLNADDTTGVSITLRPDYTIFEANSFDYEKFAERFREISYLMKGLTITLRDERVHPYRETVFHSDNGLLDYVTQLNAGISNLHEPIYHYFEVAIPRERYEPLIVKVDFAFQYADKPSPKMLSFVNTVEVTDGGQHIQAFQSAIANLINEERFSRAERGEEFSPKETVQGLTLVMHILHPNPSYRSNMYRELYVEPELYRAVSEAVFRVYQSELPISELEEWLTKHREDSQTSQMNDITEH